MRKFYTDNSDRAKEITYQGVTYYFISAQEGVGIRRKDNKIPKQEEVDALTQYLFDEGWINQEDYEDYDEV
jgi:YHS domain-containing protein